MPQDTNLPKKSWQQSRWLMAFLGLLLLVIGEIQIASSKITSTSPTQFGQWLNTTLHLDIPSIDNVINGLPILILGAFLLAIALRGLLLLPKEAELEERKPFSFQLIALSWPGILCATALFGTILWSLATRDYSLWMVIGWLISVILVISIIGSWDQQRGVSLFPNLSRHDLLWMLGLIIIGLVVGVYRLQGLPDSLTVEESNFWLAARDIATGVSKPSIFGLGVNSYPVLSSYVQALTLKVFGINLWGWRFSSVLAGLVTIFPLYMLAHSAFNRKVAITSSIALIVSPYFLAFSRLGSPDIQALFITTLALYWLYIGLNRDSHLYIFLTGCAAGFGVYTHFSIRITLLIALAFVGLMWLGRKISFRKAAFAFVLLFFGTLLIMGPYLVNGIIQHAGITDFKSLVTSVFNTLNGELFYTDQELFAFVHPIQFHGFSIFFNPKIYLELIVRGLTRTLLSIQKPGIISGDFISFPLAGTIGVFFFLIGLGIVFIKYKQPRSLLLIIWFVCITFVLSALFTEPPRYSYMVSIIPVLSIFSGLGLWAVADMLSLVQSRFVKYRGFILVFLCCTVCLGGMIDYFVVMPSIYLPQPDQIMSWAVSSNSPDTSFYYIYSSPDDQSFQPFILSGAVQQISFETISVDTFTQSSLALNAGKKTVIFYAPDISDKVVPVMQTDWGNQYIQKSFYSADGIPIFAAGMNIPFVFVRDQSFLQILKASFLHQSFLIFMTFLFGLFLVITLYPVAWMRPLQERLKLITVQFNSPAHSIVPKADPEEFFEEILASPAEEVPGDPPEWAEQVFQPKSLSNSGRVQAETKRVSLEDGNDYYVKIHIPAVRLFGFRSPDKIEFSLPLFQIPNPILLIFPVLLAVVAQIMIHGGNFLVGIILYLLGAAGLIAWIQINPRWTNVFGNQWRISALAEKLLFGILLLLTAFIRYYDLNLRVYGIDGDEVKWTIQSWYSTILMVGKGDFISHYVFMPVSFWIRSVFLRLFGLNYVTPRIESATLSILSVVFLYLFVRRLTSSKPLALLSALLYSFSYLDLNLAHQAMGETTPEVWIILCFYILLVALQERKAWQFQLTGILNALGMLTFESFLPSPVIALAFLACLGLYEVLEKKTSARIWLRNLLMVAWPVILVYFVYTQGILNVRHGYDVGILMQFSGNGSNILGIFPFLLRNITHLLETIFSHIVWTDSILYWGGSLIDAILLPFVVIGFVYNFWNIRRPYYVLIPLWFFIHAAVGPLSLGAVYPRVLFTVLGPLMIWGAMGLWTFLAALRACFKNLKIKLAVPIFILVLFTIIFNDYHIFTSSVFDTIDNQKRRELADLTVQSAGNAPMILYTYLPNQEDSLDVETSVILLSVAGKTHLGEDAADRFKQLSFSQVLTTLWDDRQLSSVDMFFDNTTYLQDQRKDALDHILTCYPGAVLENTGKFFSVYHFNSDSLSHPSCYEGSAPVNVSPQNGATLQTGSPITFTWDTNGVKSTSYTLTLDQKDQGTYLIEVEDTFIGPHWVYSSGFVNGFSGGGFLLDDWQAGDANYTFTVPQDGNYRIWIRSYKRRVNDQHNFIDINGKKLEFAGDNNALNEWVWDDLGTYHLSKGQLPMTLSRTYGTDEQYSVFIDSLLITSDLVTPPDQVKIWNNIVNTSEIPSTASEYALPDILPPGDYRWTVRVYDGNFLVDSSGIRGEESTSSAFSINP